MPKTKAFDELFEYDAGAFFEEIKSDPVLMCGYKRYIEIVGIQYCPKWREDIHLHLANEGIGL